jgi:hypothetical protein
MRAGGIESRFHSSKRSQWWYTKMISALSWDIFTYSAGWFLWRAIPTQARTHDNGRSDGLITMPTSAKFETPPVLYYPKLLRRAHVLMPWTLSHFGKKHWILDEGRWSVIVAQSSLEKSATSNWSNPGNYMLRDDIYSRELSAVFSTGNGVTVTSRTNHNATLRRSARHYYFVKRKYNCPKNLQMCDW